jgi:hypothetical protein
MQNRMQIILQSLFRKSHEVHLNGQPRRLSYERLKSLVLLPYLQLLSFATTDHMLDWGQRIMSVVASS